MPLQILRQDIVRVRVDAIVTAGNAQMIDTGGVDGAIRAAAGRRLKTPTACAVGEAVVLSAGKLRAKYLIHTVGPVWQGGTHNECELLSSCYRRSLEAAKAHSCRSIAFPLLSSGENGYPKDQALRVAVDTISEFLSQNDMDVFLVVFDRDSYEISSQLYQSVQSYIDETYEGLQDRKRSRRRFRPLMPREWDEKASDGGLQAPMMAPTAASMPQPLEQVLDHLEESFSQMLLRKIDEKGLSDVECYRKANLDRRLFSKIRSNRSYQPSKRTALALAVALELSLDETNELLRAAGFAISHANKFDIIVEYFIRNQNFNIYQINEVLFKFDQALLGS